MNMMQSTWKRGLALVAIAFAIAVGGVVCAQGDVAPEKAMALDSAKQLLQSAAAQDHAKAVLAFANELALDAPTSDYWLGVQVAAVPDLAKKQLAIDDGLAVEDVTDGSPAAKAEIKKFDILVRAGDAPLKGISDLVKAV